MQCYYITITIIIDICKKYKKKIKYILHIYFRYHIEFSVPWNICIHTEKQTAAPAVIAGNYNANCHIVDFTQEKDTLRYKTN